jgi:TonB family protein
VVGVKVVKGVRPDVDEAAQQAVRSTGFEPALKDGKPIQATVMIPIFFRLKERP